jgi:nucleoid-associated protein YgaU
MTSDAKIGLLLGLVFIFVIAFVINGLPGLHNKAEDGNKLTGSMVGLQNSAPGLGANERKVLETTAPAAPVGENAPPAQAVTGSSETRFTMTLPQGAPATTDAAPTAPAVIEPVADAHPQPVTTPAPSQPTIKTESAKPAAAKVYVVQDGDSLSSIAKKCYGEQEGKKLANINAIFEANKKTLASVDELQVGQKLVIPPLAAAVAPTPSPANVLGGQSFKKVESVGQRHSPANTEKSAAPAKAESSKQGKIYVVKEGDCLWRIAADQLGDGNRYKEIVKLNSDKLSSEDDIQVDMELKLPAK